MADVSADASITVIRSYVETVEKDFRRLEEISDQQGRKSLPSIGKFN
jgi:hypothetical protein